MLLKELGIRIIVPSGRPILTPFLFASSSPDTILSLNVSVSASAISDSRASMIPVAGFLFPDGKSVSMRC